MSVPASVDQARQTRDDVTTLLRDWRNGNQSALNRLTPLIYEDLIRLARARLKGERREFTLDPTALVHECYLRLADQTRLDVESRAHFYTHRARLWQCSRFSRTLSAQSFSPACFCVSIGFLARRDPVAAFTASTSGNKRRRNLFQTERPFR